ncbi:hypothetical protein K402DRAFT_105538 [Aulographum hederae CBS 113979]|uniref:Uncharacterized protein n=1 Tax=Aulographum hederae CBS 113979 TaxID=1176131 RepID=A0A6G1GY50_9PEZI|nr:hypothetical protein K402DRAFT_105538 [Aulographum hederae CBS 113979]
MDLHIPNSHHTCYPAGTSNSTSRVVKPPIITAFHKAFCLLGSHYVPIRRAVAMVTLISISHTPPTHTTNSIPQPRMNVLRKLMRLPTYTSSPSTKNNSKILRRSSQSLRILPETDLSPVASYLLRFADSFFLDFPSVPEWHYSFHLLRPTGSSPVYSKADEHLFFFKETQMMPARSPSEIQQTRLSTLDSFPLSLPNPLHMRLNGITQFLWVNPFFSVFPKAAMYQILQIGMVSRLHWFVFRNALMLVLDEAGAKSSVPFFL